MTTSETQQPVSVMYDHCCAVYKEMMANAITRMSDEGDIVVYEGHLTKLFTKLRLSVPYYTTVKNELVRMGCIRQLRRGGGNAPSVWELITEPTEDAFRNGKVARTPGGKLDMYAQQLRDLGSRMTEVERAVNQLIDAYNKKGAEDG